MRRAVHWILLAGLSGFFIYAAAGKLIDPQEFARAILNYRLVGAQLALVGALWLPWLEVVAGACLVARAVRRAASWLLLLLMGVFQLALLSAWMRGLDIECGCLGGGDSATVEVALVRNVFLIAALLTLLRLNRQAV